MQELFNKASFTHSEIPPKPYGAAKKEVFFFLILKNCGKNEYNIKPTNSTIFKLQFVHAC